MAFYFVFHSLFVTLADAEVAVSRKYKEKTSFSFAFLTFFSIFAA